MDISFLDVRMEGGMDGIELALRLRKADPQLTVVFVTTSREYALDAYVGQLADAEELGQRPALCDNAAIDALAAHYDTAAQARGVRVSWNLSLPESLPIPEPDVCAVLGNLVENALQATEALPETMRWVEAISQEVTTAALGIVARNPCEGRIAFGEDGLPTTDTPDHGVGLSSVAATVERYHGGIDAHFEDGIFSCGVVLYYA